MNAKANVKGMKTVLFTTLLILILALIAVVSSTQAWLEVSRVPFVSDISVSVISENALLIAPDTTGVPGEWSTYLDASEYLTGMAPLYPATYKDGAFYKVVYGETGQVGDLTELTEEDINVFKSENPEESLSLEDSSVGYLLRLNFWLKTEGTKAFVNLSGPTKTEDGQLRGGTYAVGEPIWNDATLKHVDGGSDSQYSLRMGFLIQHTDRDCRPIGNAEFFIYEPNADIHYEESNNGKILTTKNADGGAYIDASHLITQYASTWEETKPVLADTVVYNVGDFLNSPNLFHISETEYINATLYIWMEGQDEDCIAAAVDEGASILANIQFGAIEDERGQGVTRK